MKKCWFFFTNFDRLSGKYVSHRPMNNFGIDLICYAILLITFWIVINHWKVYTHTYIENSILIFWWDFHGSRNKTPVEIQKKNKPERLFGLQVRCRELDIFKIRIFLRNCLKIFWEFFGFFFWNFWFFLKIFLNFSRGILWEELFLLL